MNEHKATIVVDRLPTEMMCRGTGGNPRAILFAWFVIFLGAFVLKYMGYFDKAKPDSHSNWIAPSRKIVTNTPSTTTAAPR